MLLFDKIKAYLLVNTSSKQTIIKNTFRLMLAEGGSKGSMFLITILIARQLGPEQFGVMSFVISFVSMFIVLTDFGLTTLMVREVSRDQSKLSEYFVNGNFLKIILGIMTFLVVWGVSQFIGKPDFYISLILIYCGYAVINNIGEFIRAFFRPAEDMQYEAVLKIVNGMLVLLIIGGALYMGYGLQGIFWGYMLSGGLSLIISIGFVLGRKKIDNIKINSSTIKFVFYTGGFLLAGTLATNRFNYVDQVILGFFRTEIELGYYAVAYKIINIIAIFSALVANALYPQLSKLIHEKGKIIILLKRITKKTILIGSIFIVANLILSKQFIPLVFGKIFYNAVLPYNILIFSFIVIFLNNVYGSILIVMKQEKKYLLTVVISLIINLVLNIIFIPLYGIVAAAVSTVLTEIVCFLLYKYLVDKQLRKSQI